MTLSGLNSHFIFYFYYYDLLLSTGSIPHTLCLLSFRLMHDISVVFLQFAWCLVQYGTLSDV